jgi:hypothetical protein
MRVERTPQELFKLMLYNWDNINAVFICVKINTMLNMEHITENEHRIMSNFLFLNKKKAIYDFGAKPYLSWWLPDQQKERKQFVKYLSETV